MQLSPIRRNHSLQHHGDLVRGESLPANHRRFQCHAPDRGANNTGDIRLRCNTNDPNELRGYLITSTSWKRPHRLTS